jgi:hypothetical protein
MDTLSEDRRLIETILTEHASIPYAHGRIDRLTVFDRERDHYLLVISGWDDRRVHGCVVHVDLIDGKFWIQRDGTEDGIAGDLERAGVPKGRIVLGFREPKVRPYTGYAVA